MPFLERIHSVEDVRADIIEEFSLQNIYKQYAKQKENMRNRNLSTKVIPKIK